MYSLEKHCGGCGNPFTRVRLRNLEARLKTFNKSGTTFACCLCQKCARRLLLNDGIMGARPRKAAR
jgi:hypothetical protein